MAYYGPPPPYSCVAQPAQSTFVVQQQPVVAPVVLPQAPPVQVVHNTVTRTVVPSATVVATPGGVVVGGAPGVNVVTPGYAVATPGVTVVSPGMHVGPVMGKTTTTYVTRGYQRTVVPGVRTTTTIYKH